MQNKTSRRGFTLIELLVVMTIIGVLAALILPGLARSQQKAWQVGCQANMRNIGTALSGWVEDHSGWLPPGQGSSTALFYGQLANYNVNTKQHLAYYLASYLGCLAPTNQDQFVPQFTCPGLRHRVSSANISSYVSYTRTDPNITGLTQDGESQFDPFGSPPQKKDAVAAKQPLVNVWVLVDADKLAGGKGSDAGTLSDVPNHGDQRNYVYFDGHVAAKKVPDNGAL